MVKRPKRLLPSHSGSWIGIDENGLGARLGPLIVTGVRALVSDEGSRFLRRALPARLREDLDDSKALVSSKDFALGEAWARALAEHCAKKAPATPRELYALLSSQEDAELREHCPAPAMEQCFFQAREEFAADRAEVTRLLGHLDYLAERGVTLSAVRTLSVCTGSLNRLKAAGKNRFQADLLGMERLLLELRQSAPEGPVLATCGKVGGMAQYGKFFDRLGGRLHVCLGEGAAESAYSFPGLFEVSFLRDADSIDALVMLASLVGKYIRELLMGRIARFYLEGDARERPSGYHDPVTDIFVQQTSARRRTLQIANACFERDKEAGGAPTKGSKPAGSGAPRATKQTSLF